MRILNVDVETSPALAYIWDLKTRYVPPSNVVEQKRLLCFAAKWQGEKKVYFYSRWHEGQARMVEHAWQFLNAADVVLHYNGKRFDVPVLNTEFALESMGRPAPFQQVDLYRTVKNQFAFLSSSLNEVTRHLGTSGKMPNDGMALWHAVNRGDPSARKQMRLYNIHDVLANEGLYNRLLPWIDRHPNVGLLQGFEGCTSCGSVKVTRQGFAYTSAGCFQRFRCTDCGRWMRSAARVGTTKYREAA